MFDVINISGTLFVWEGVSTAFLQRNAEMKVAKRIAKAVKDITVE